MLKKWIAVMLLAMAVGGCAAPDQAALLGKENQPAPKPAEKTELFVSAAASLTDCLKEIQPLYEKEHEGVKLVFNFGASGALQQQIEQGAPADLFLSAGKAQMNALVEKQLIDGKRQANLAANELVVVVPQDSKVNFSRLDGLSRPEIKKIAAGEPASVPAGSYTKDALVNSKLWDAVQPKLVFGKDVRQVLSYVETGNADAGFVYKTDALTSPKVKVALTVDPRSYEPIEYPMGVVKESKHTEEAAQLYAYLQSQPARDILLKYGFSPAPS